MRKLWFLFIAGATIFVCYNTVSANGLSLNSIGTRALGMGGAMVGLADDATAIYWNPAGLSNVKGGFAGFYLTGIQPMPTYSWQYPGFGIDINAKGVRNVYLGPNLFTSYQTDAWTFGFGVFVPAGLGTEWNGDELLQLSGGSSFEWMSRIGVVNFAPAVSYRFSEKFSLGLTVNIYYGFFDMKRPVEVASNTYAQYNEESNGTGIGVTVGAQYKVNEMFALGASWRSKTSLKMSGTAENPAFAFSSAPTKSEFDREVAWPMWIAAGLSVKLSECWKINFDVQYSQWSESEDILVTEYKQVFWRQALEPSEGNLLVLKWKDATQIRFGTEYLATESLALRMGYYYDPAPAPDETLNILFPSSTNNVITAGAGYKAGSWEFQAGAEYLIGKARSISTELNSEGFVNEMPGQHQMDIFSWSIGLGYSF